MSKRSSWLLRYSLAANVAVSLSCGIVAAAFGAQVAPLVGNVPAWLVTVIGSGLMIFAAAIVYTLVRLRIGQALVISLLDMLWVVVTVPLVFVPGLLTPLGGPIVLGIAAIVGALAVSQLAGIRQMLIDHTAQGGALTHCVRVYSAADAQALWSVIRDLGAISRYSAGLTSSRVEGDSMAPGTVRVCTNMRQQSWAEEVIALDENARSVTFRFRAEAHDFPFPLAAMTGGWIVTPSDGGGCFVDIWWTVVPKQRRFGWLVVSLLTIPLDHELPQVVSAMEAQAMGMPPKQTGTLALGYC